MQAHFEYFVKTNHAQRAADWREFVECVRQCRQLKRKKQQAEQGLHGTYLYEFASYNSCIAHVRASVLQSSGADFERRTIRRTVTCPKFNLGVPCQSAHCHARLNNQKYYDACVQYDAACVRLKKFWTDKIAQRVK